MFCKVNSKINGSVVDYCQYKRHVDEDYRHLIDRVHMKKCE